jgi:isocitrate dehydrogenase
MLLATKYRATDFVVKGKGKLKISFESESGEKQEYEVFNYSGEGGVALAMYNTDESIRGFARSCMNMALQKGWPVVYEYKKYHPEKI